MISKGTARQVLKDLYDIDADLTKLYGEFDDNYLAVGGNGQKQILKIMHVGCEEQRVDLQCQAMKHLEGSASELNLPAVMPTTSGQLYTVAELDGTERLVWLLRFCEGTLLADVSPQTDELIRSFGRTLGLLDVGFKSFSHSAMRPGHEWELTRAGEARTHVQHVAADAAELADDVLRRFETGTAGKLERLPHSVIHNDANDGNVLVNFTKDGSPRVDGLIDFGDISYQPTVCEVAIALSYVVIRKDDPLSACASFLEGYNEINPLSGDELAVLYDLIMARIAVSIAITAVRRSKNPDDPVGSQDKRPATRALALLDNISRQEAESQFRNACAM